MRIAKHKIGQGNPVYVVAEMSANHNNSFEHAVKIIQAAAEAGANAVKVQTYTADTMTLDCDGEEFQVNGGTLWDGRSYYDLYKEASMPWEWQPELKNIANESGMDFFSSPFDESAVEFLEAMDVPAYKVASFEIVDIPLLTRIAKTGKPVIVSTGMATQAEIEEALNTLRDNGATEIALLKCTSAYPAPPESMNLKTIPDMARRYGVEVGLSDHTLGIAAPVAAVSLGACIIEKHFTLSRNDPGPDSSFSLEPHELRQMIEAIRIAERVVGSVHYGPASSDKPNLNIRRSLYAIREIRKGEIISETSIRAIRPGHGLHTRHLTEIIGKRAAAEIPRGTPLSWELIQKD
ncbi:pseudaminic acid synthase [bacterium]|nr:pseudaminic acid synthase [bacterium]